MAVLDQYLSQAQIDEIRNLYQAGLNSQGNYSHIYKYIGDQLQSSDVKNWFRGAEQANAGNGAYSAMIRGYSKRQMELRGIDVSDPNALDVLMQAASNKVADNAIADILRSSRQQPDGSWLFPTVAEIASRDAIGVGEILFDPYLQAGDTARSDIATNGFNAAWAGTILFTPLNSAQTWRLTQGGGVGLNSLDDVKNILFAYDALSAGIHEAKISGINDFGDANFAHERPGSGLSLSHPLK
jgi:hypothetical protein